MKAAKSARIVGLTVALGVLGQVLPVPALAGSPGRHPPGWQHHRPPPADYYHPRRGPRYVVVDRLPRGYRHVVYRGQPYYYHAANWYQPYGVRYAAVSPPAGVIIDRRGVAVIATFPLVRW